MPRSVMMPVMSDRSVTSKAGLKTFTPSGAMRRSYHISVTSSPGRCSMGIAAPSGIDMSMVELGAQT